MRSVTRIWVIRLCIVAAIASLSYSKSAEAKSVEEQSTKEEPTKRRPAGKTRDERTSAMNSDGRISHRSLDRTLQISKQDKEKGMTYLRGILVVLEEKRKKKKQRSVKNFKDIRGNGRNEAEVDPVVAHPAFH